MTEETPSVCIDDDSDDMHAMHDCGDIFRRFGQEYERTHDMTGVQRRVMRAVASCRTSALGGHAGRCTSCGHEEISYNSCRDRHCPKCQGINSRIWVAERISELLPVQYFHLVFTVPSPLNDSAQLDAKAFYNVLMDASSESLIRMFRDVHGAVPAVVSVLHTWGSSMCLHPHVHMIVSGGGLDVRGSGWTSVPDGFLLDVKDLSRRFRDTFARMFRRRFPGQLEPAGVFEKDWVAFCRKPFAGAEEFVEYVGRYTHRAAISNRRIRDFNRETGVVTIEYKDYRAGDADAIPEIRTMELPAMEFIRRFLQHCLPKGFRKIRFYGIFAGKKRYANIARCRCIFNLPPLQKTEIEKPEHNVCTRCGGEIIFNEEIMPPSAPHIVFRNETWRKSA
ncbi:Putative transposase [uncultured archaeon]|nr:Putative transposase [uncultured archaeon]